MTEELADRFEAALEGFGGSDGGAVVVVLTNRPVAAITAELFYGALRPLVDALGDAN